MAELEIRKDGTITGKCCPVFDYKRKKIFTIDSYKKGIQNEFIRIRKLTSLLSPWVKKRKIDKIRLI